MRTVSPAILLAPILILGSLTFSFGPAIAAPSQIYGKSVVVSWNEDRQQRVNGEEIVRNVSRSAQFSVYVSSAGKVFSRMGYAFSGNRGGLKTGKKDAVSGESSRNVSFTGNSMTMVGGHGSGGARSIHVTFDGGFQGCSAQVVSGKESGASSIRAKSMVTGEAIEILSIKTGAASCSVKDGNVFGE